MCQDTPAKRHFTVWLQDRSAAQAEGVIEVEQPLWQPMSLYAAHVAIHCLDVNGDVTRP